MLIRVAANDVDSAKLLVSGLVGLFGGEAVSLRADGEVHARLNGASGQRGLSRALASVEGWLEETGIGATDVWVDERQYRMERRRRLDQVAGAQ
jgi:hypothetical protein